MSSPCQYQAAHRQSSAQLPFGEEHRVRLVELRKQVEQAQVATLHVFHQQAEAVRLAAPSGDQLDRLVAVVTYTPAVNHLQGALASYARQQLLEVDVDFDVLQVIIIRSAYFVRLSSYG